MLAIFSSRIYERNFDILISRVRNVQGAEEKEEEEEKSETTAHQRSVARIRRLPVLNTGVGMLLLMLVVVVVVVVAGRCSCNRGSVSSAVNWSFGSSSVAVACDEIEPRRCDAAELSVGLL